MKHTTIIIAALSLLIPWSLYSAEASPTLTQDAATLSSSNGTSWRSGILDLQFKDGSHAEEILVVEFAPFAGGIRTNPPHASARVSLTAPPKGVKGIVEVSASVGESAPSDVRLQEKDGVRTITFTRAIEAIEHPKPKTQRILDQNYSTSFTYELRGDTLILKGFSKDGTKWGSLLFTAPEREITFKAVK